MIRIPGRNWRAGAPLIAALLQINVSYRASGQTEAAESPSNVGCLERLEIPEYPQLARLSRVQGVQTVRVHLSERATVESVESSIAARPAAVEEAFKKGVEKALKSSQFSKACAGKAITFVFHYELNDASHAPFAFGPPNYFWIRTGPSYVQKVRGR